MKQISTVLRQKLKAFENGKKPDLKLNPIHIHRWFIIPDSESIYLDIEGV